MFADYVAIDVFGFNVGLPCEPSDGRSGHGPRKGSVFGFCVAERWESSDGRSHSECVCTKESAAVVDDRL